MNQYVITGTKTFTYYKTVIADNIVDAHIKAHEPVEDPIDAVSYTHLTLPTSG